MLKSMVVATALLAGASMLAPSVAEARDGRTGAFVGGLAAGVVTGTLLGAATNPGYAAPAPGYYVAPAEPVYVEPSCVIRRVPLYDEYGNFAGYQRRRVCR